MRSLVALIALASACAAPAPAPTSVEGPTHAAQRERAREATAEPAVGGANGPAIDASVVVARAPSITSVAAEPKSLDSSTADVARVTFALDLSAQVSLDVFDEHGRVVRTLALGELPAGDHEAVWDARDASDRPVDAGVYRYAIRARNAGGETVHEPSTTTGGEEILPPKFTFDETTGELAWLMPRAGRARLRAGVTDFPHLVTLLDWTPMEAGRQTLHWNGLDDAGLVRVVDHPRRVILLSLYALPDNALIVRGDEARERGVRRESAPYPAEHEGSRAYMHAAHPRELCGEIEFEVELGERDRVRLDASGKPILTGVVPVKVRMAHADARRLVDAKFEVAIYEDLEFLFEEEDAVHPFTFLWDTTQLAPGEHLLTIDIIGYDDHFGVETIPVVIGERP